MMQKEKIAIGLGSNLGDRLSMLQKAAKLIEEEFLEEAQFSLVYETEPWGITDQPKFLNAVIVGLCEWKPPSIINYLKTLEQKLGRTPNEKYGPREIDCDLLVYGSKTWESEGVTVPHAQIKDRDFVLVPMKEVWPEWVHPVEKKSVNELCDLVRGSNRSAMKSVGRL